MTPAKPCGVPHVWPSSDVTVCVLPPGHAGPHADGHGNLWTRAGSEPDEWWTKADHAAGVRRG